MSCLLFLISGILCNILGFFVEEAVGFYSQGISKTCSVNSVNRPSATFLNIPMFQYTKGAYTNGVPVPVPTQGWTVHHLTHTCTAHSWGHAGMRTSVYICSCGVVQYCAGQNATLVYCSFKNFLPKLRTVRHNKML